MAKVADGALKQWNDGDVVKAFDYKQEREILKTAINANDDSIKTLENETRGTGGLAERTTNLETKTSKLASDGSDFTGTWQGRQPNQLLTQLKPSMLLSPGLKVFEFHVNEKGAIVTTQIEEGFTEGVMERLRMRSEDNTLWEITVDDDGLLVTKEVM